MFVTEDGRNVFSYIQTQHEQQHDNMDELDVMIDVLFTMHNNYVVQLLVHAQCFVRCSDSHLVSVSWQWRGTRRDGS